MESTIVESAQRYASWGLAVHWLRSPRGSHEGAGKAPIESGWQKKPYTAPDSVAGTFRTGYNLGIRTGIVSGTALAVVVVDLDSPEAIAWARSDLLPTPIRTLTGRGEHWFYRHPGDGKIGNRAKLRGYALDVRGDGGQVVAPGSIHPTTRQPYKEAEPWTQEALASMPVFDRAWLAEPKQTAEVAPSKGHAALAAAEARIAAASEGQRNDILNREAFLIGKYIERGELDPTDVKTRLSAAARLTGLPEEEIGNALRDTATGALAAGQRGADRTKERQPSTATSLITMATEHSAELFLSDGVAFASVLVDGHRETWAVRSRDFDNLLRRWYFSAKKSVPKQPDLTDAVALLEARAGAEGESRPVFLRVGQSADTIYLDLGDSSWRAVEVTASGWRIIANPPICFRRSRGMRALPLPIAGGTLRELFQFVNVPEESQPLVLGWLAAALRPGLPLPLLAIHGEQGSGKTSLTKALRALIDPHSADVRGAPRDDRTLMIGARHAWLLAFDNLSGLPPWLSDFLCCLSTGGAYTARTLYSDDGETILHAQRPVILNGIAELATRADLLDRCALISLPPLPERMRKSEAELRRRFGDALPRLLGGLLDAISCALRRMPEVKLDHMPRMGDFAEWATAAEPALGLPPGGFLDAYRENIQATADLPLEASAIVEPLRAFLDNQPPTLAGVTCWTGMATQLLQGLQQYATADVTKQPDWPRNGQALSGLLNRLAPNLRQKGIVIERSKAADRKRTRTLTIRTELC